PCPLVQTKFPSRVIYRPPVHGGVSALLYEKLLSSLFKAACYLAKGECIPIVDGCGLIRFQALAVDAGGVCAVQVGHRVGAADVLKSGVNTRGRIRTRYGSKVYLRLDATNVVIVASYYSPF